MRGIAYKYKYLGLISILRIEMLKMSYCGTKNVGIYVGFSGKFPDYGKYAGVKYLTNTMSAATPPPSIRWIKNLSQY